MHSLHAYFLRPGESTWPTIYEVERVDDGRSFTTRRVVATQRGRDIFLLSASFHRDETGLSHQWLKPPAPDPEEVARGGGGHELTSAPLPTPPTTLQLASLDHAMWFHRPFRADE